MDAAELETKPPAPTSCELLGLDSLELAEVLQENFLEKPYRSRQLFQWIYQHRSRDFDSMSNISKASRDVFKQSMSIYRPKIEDWQESKDGTIKFLIELEDGSLVESVLICQPKRYTLCISSQVGCAIGCSFCRTALMGLKRQLKTHEIIGQVMVVKDFVANPPAAVLNKPKDFKNIVFMGMGEPLHNADNVFRAARILTDPNGLQFSYKRITISTSGLIPKIEQFANKKIPASLAVSLNATTDEQRNTLIPINKKWPIEKLISALKYYTAQTSREVTIEYVMLAGVNDSDQDLKRLSKLVYGFPMKLNLIPYNDNSGLGYKSPEKKQIEYWQDALSAKGFNTRVRWSKGEDIDAACGQLATRK